MSPLNTITNSVMQQFNTKPPLQLPPPIKPSSDSDGDQDGSSSTAGTKSGSPRLLDKTV